MDVSVLATVIDKFKYLWQSGQDATLTVDTRAGKAWIKLEVQLGHSPGPLHNQAHRDTPTRRRRRERRARAREEKATEEAAATVHDDPEIATLIVTTVDAAVQVAPPKPSLVEAAVQAVPQHRHTAAQAHFSPQPTAAAQVRQLDRQ